MTKDKLMKCPICESMVPKSESVYYKKRYHHQDCYNKRKASEADEEKRKDLIDYILELHNTKVLSGIVIRQIKEFKEQNNYTYEGMRLTLWYFHELKGNPVTTEGIGIIPYMYSEAKEYYIKKVRAIKHIDKLKEDGLIKLINEKTIKIKPKKLEVKEREKVDISKIL